MSKSEASIGMMLKYFLYDWAEHKNKLAIVFLYLKIKSPSYQTNQYHSMRKMKTNIKDFCDIKNLNIKHINLGFFVYKTPFFFLPS